MQKHTGRVRDGSEQKIEQIKDRKTEKYDINTHSHIHMYGTEEWYNVPRCENSKQIKNTSENEWARTEKEN